jgi:hypothetical protein
MSIFSAEKINEIHNIQGIVFGALIGSSLSTIEINPDSVVGGIVIIVLISYVLFSCMFAHFIYYVRPKIQDNRTYNTLLAGNAGIFLPPSIYGIIDSIYDYDIIEVHLGIDRSRVVLMIITIFMWYFTSMFFGRLYRKSP